MEILSDRHGFLNYPGPDRSLRVAAAD